MKIGQLSRELGVPVEWIAPKHIHDAMTLVTVSSNSGERSVLISSRGLRVVDSQDYVVAPKERVQAQRNAYKHYFGIATKSLAWVFVSFMILFAGSSTLGLIDARVVLTGSMTPAINPGDIMVTTSISHVTPEIGDVVVYTGKKFDGTTVASFAHRIIGGDAKHGFIVKGDHNPEADVQRPTLDEIEGVGLFTVPFVGKLLTPQTIILLLIAGFGIWLIVDAFRDEE